MVWDRYEIATKILTERVKLDKSEWRKFSVEDIRGGNGHLVLDVKKPVAFHDWPMLYFQAYLKRDQSIYGTENIYKYSGAFDGLKEAWEKIGGTEDLILEAIHASPLEVIKAKRKLTEQAYVSCDVRR